MAAILPHLSRPTVSSLGFPDFVCQSCRRHQSTYRRTRKALKVRPDASFRPSTTETADHIIFNPPSSAPSVYQTPLKFLPASDPRRKHHSAAAALSPSNGVVLRPASFPDSLLSSTNSSSSDSSSALPPSVRPVYEKKYHLTQTQVDEMRRLRALDPRKWTRLALAAKFECSQFFVSICCEAPKQVRDENQRNLDAIKARWGRWKSEAREARQERKKLWGRDV